MRYTQPQKGPFKPSTYWLNRGLEMVFLGGRVVWNRDPAAVDIVSVGAGTPKTIVAKSGLVQGFGTTYGTGTSDYLTGQKLRPPTINVGRSIVAHVYPKTTGGGGLGRIFQDVSGDGLAKGESFYISTVPGITFGYTDASSAHSSAWTPSFTVPTARWMVLGISVPFSTSGGTTASGYLDGVVKATATNGYSVTTTSNAPTNMAWGNRPSDSLRCFDGMIGAVLIFNGVLTALEHALLAANPWQVFDNDEFSLWVPSTGGTIYTITPSGGVVFAGSSSEIKTKIQSPSGGLVFSGAPALIKTRLQTASGTLTFGGTAPFSTAATYTISPSGGMTFAGTGNEVKQKTILPTGTLSFGGTLSEVLVRTQVPSGGITFSGTLITYRTKVFVPTGTITFSGTAPLINPAAPVAQGTWRTLTNAGI